MFDHILVVCVGNICRSPVAQYFLQQKLPSKNVFSAGLSAMVDSDMDPSARSVAEQHGLICPAHSATQITPAMCRKADLILVMENFHREALGALCPEARGKVFLLGGLLDGTEIADPYRRDRHVFELVHASIVRAAESWVQKLNVGRS